MDHEDSNDQAEPLIKHFNASTLEASGSGLNFKTNEQLNFKLNLPSGINYKEELLRAKYRNQNQLEIINETEEEINQPGKDMSPYIRANAELQSKILKLQMLGKKIS